MHLFLSAARSVPALSVLLLVCAVSARAQPAQPRAQLSRFEIGAYVSSKQSGEPVGGDRGWTGPGLSLEVNRNVSERFALATRVESYFDRTVTALAGTQVSTGFDYWNKRDRIPGRFFAKALAGAVRESSGVTRPVLYLGVGAGGILSGTRGVGLQWEAGWEIVPGDPDRRFRGRVAIGVLFGPHTRTATSKGFATPGRLSGPTPGDCPTHRRKNPGCPG
jgi:hypothetical protein